MQSTLFLQLIAYGVVIVSASVYIYLLKYEYEFSSKRAKKALIIYCVLFVFPPLIGITISGLGEDNVSIDDILILIVYSILVLKYADTIAAWFTMYKQKFRQIFQK